MGAKARWCWQGSRGNGRGLIIRIVAGLLLLAACAPRAEVPSRPAERADPDDRQLLAVLVAGDRSIDAFGNAIAYLHDELASAGIPAGQIHAFNADPARHAGTSLARLQPILAQIGSLRPATNGSCFVFLTSHGVQGQGLYLAQDDPLSPALLDRALVAGCGDLPTVVVASACFSGQFAAPPMLRANRVILTAARADRSSFGCEAGQAFTFFDECFLGSLLRAPNWETVYIRTRGCVSVRERQIDAVPSEPQGYFGRSVEGMAAPWRLVPAGPNGSIVFAPSGRTYVPRQVALDLPDRQRLKADLRAYGKAHGPKALALVPNGLVYWTDAGAAGTGNLTDVARLALERCEYLTGGACVLYSEGDQVTELLPSGFPPFHPMVLQRQGELNPATVPFARADQRWLLSNYLGQPEPKALALSPTGGDVGIGRADSLAVARDDALSQCQSSGHECVVYAEGNQVVLGWGG